MLNIDEAEVLVTVVEPNILLADDCGAPNGEVAEAARAPNGLAAGGLSNTDCCAFGALPNISVVELVVGVAWLIDAIP